MAGGRGVGRLGRGAIAEVPDVGKRAAIRVAAPTAVEGDIQRHGASGRVCGHDGVGCGVVGAREGYAVDLPAIGKGRVVEGSVRARGLEGQVDGTALPQTAREHALVETSTARWCELKDLPADIVAKEVRVVVGGRPGGTVGNEGTAGDRGAPRVVAVLVDGRRVRRRRTVNRAR